MKILLINGSPRNNYNTGSVLKEILKGAESEGAEGEIVNLYSLNYKGCISCFECKKIGGKSYGRCILKDDLSPVLDKAHEADILVLGSPFYFFAETGLMRCCMERLWFQYYLYSQVKKPLSNPKKSTALVYTMNVKEEDIEIYGKDKTINMAKTVMERLFAPCELFLLCNTKQFDDYSLYETDIFDVPEKLKKHAEEFPKELEKAYKLGIKLAS